MEKTVLNLIKSIYKKPITFMILNGETEMLSPKIQNKQACLSSPLLFNIGLKVKINAMRQKREIRGEGLGKIK